ncbi:MAG: 16S rRNA methyltransferase [Chloroflexi bacterium CG07_land_8_20_14_0_80_51_10]|nr:MAG: 16S rRNA methyltransferase [Chloroflexi bacterium CG07_land_8_20_14_0_80_51_10]
MHRFFILPACVDRDRIIISGRQAHQLKEVLRLKVGDQIIVLDDSGFEYQVKLVDIKNTSAIGEVAGRYPCPNEPSVEITLYQALLKSNKFDLVLQKCTEIGVVRFVPVICERCIAGGPSSSRIGHWQRIIVEAAEQSGRGRIPNLHPVAGFEEACEGTDGFALLPWEGEEVLGIKAALGGWAFGDGNAKLSIFVGPEGGFSPQEVELARSRGIVPVTLGKRILRAETAGLVASAAILYEYGELGG